MKRTLFYLGFFLVPGFLFSQNLNWANQYGAPQGSATILKVAMAPNGDIVSTGYFKGTVDFDPSDAVHELVTISPINDWFITRNGPDGSFISVIRLAGTWEEMVPLAVDAENNSYTLSVFESSFDYDPTDNVMELAPSSERNVALAKYDGNGNLAWAKQFGSSIYMTPKALITDESGNLYATMLFAGDLIYDSQELYSGLSATNRSVILKIDPLGNVIWHSIFNENTWVNNMAISPSGKLFTVGAFFGTADFDLSDSEFPLTSNGSWDAFMSIYNTDGSHSDAFRIGQGQKDGAHSLAFYPNNDVVMVGEFLHQIDCIPNGNGGVLNTAGGKDGSFIAKYDAELNLVWQKQICRTAHSFISDVAIDTDGNVCSVGWYDGTASFDPTDTYNNLAITTAYRDGFISKLNSDGEYVIGGAFSGSSDNDQAFTIAAGDNGSIFIGGKYGLSIDIDPSEQEHILTGTSGENGFLIKMDDFATSVPFLSETITLNAYPNPSNGEVTVQKSTILNSKDINIYNHLGQKINANIVQSDSQIGVKIDGAKGVYFLEIIWQDASRTTAKLVKE